MLSRCPRLVILLTFLCLSLLAGFNFAQQQGQRALSRVQNGKALDGRGNLWAVIVGVSAYKNVSAEEQLRFAHRDAEAFSAFLRSPSGGGFSPNNIKLLLNQNATISAIRTALGTWLPRSAEPEDVVYIFFAGHGVVEGERDGYLLAHDSDPQNLYATALQVAELDTIIRERLRARVVVLLADACHAGKLGWTSRGTGPEVMINRYLDEVGKSGAGVYRLLASRADERSFEDKKWGGGHGAFTYFLLEGLGGKADKDKDGFVRVAELLGYLSTNVPEATQALQHPRAAGNIDPSLPLAVLADTAAPNIVTSTTKPASVNLEILGTPGSEVYVNKAFRGRIRPDGVLVVENLQPGRSQVSIDEPGKKTVTEMVTLSSARTVLDLRPVPARPAEVKSSPLVAQIRQSLERGLILEPNGAWPLYRRMMQEAPKEPQRNDIEADVSTALQEIGQQAISDYVNSPVSQLGGDVFHRAAQAYRCLRMMNPNDTKLEARQSFCEGRALIIDGKLSEAIALLKKAVSIDPKAAYAHNALGVGYEQANDQDRAMESFRRAAELAPRWILPRLHVGIQHYKRNQLDQAEDDFKTVVQMDPRYAFARWMLARCYREKGRVDEAERENYEIIRIEPRYAPAYVELGLIYEARKQYAKAADAFETYLRLAPNSPDSATVRELAARNRRLGGNKPPSLKRPKQ